MAHFRRLFFASDSFIAEAPCEHQFRHEELQAPLSYLWFCSHCGQVFARSPVIKLANGQMQEWQSFKALCGGCHNRSRNFHLVPGSIWLPWDPDYLAVLPDAVLQREATLHLQHFDRIYHD